MKTGNREVIRRRLSPLVFATAAALATTVPAKAADAPAKFFFGTGPLPTGHTRVGPDTRYDADRGYGFEPDVNVPAPGVAPMPAAAPVLAVAAGGISAEKAFIFSVKAAEGNCRVTVTLGDGGAESVTTVKAETRRLMLEAAPVPPGRQPTRSFVVNVRRPDLPGGGTIKLDPREPGSFTWDDKLSLAFVGTRPAVAAIAVEKVDVPTVYLCGDSTVTDQPREPYGSWGQMLPRWFGDTVAVANYAESGETLKAFKMQRRWEKVMSLLKAGDYVFMQFGNNDMQTSGHNAMWPAEDTSEDWANVHSAADGDYQTILKAWAAEVKARGATPVIVSPYAKQRAGAPDPAGLRGYPAAAAKAARDSDTPFLDLNAISTTVLTALGPQDGALMYVDGQHTRSYGAYVNARSVAHGIAQLKLGLAGHLLPEAAFDPAHPAPLPAAFAVPLEPAPRMGFGPRGRGAATAPATRPN